MCDSTSSRGEALRQSVQKCEQQIDQAAGREVRLPSKARGHRLAEESRVARLGLHNLRTLTFGSVDATAVGSVPAKTGLARQVAG